MSFNLQRFADEKSANLIFTCSNCGTPCPNKLAQQGCAACSGTLFKVARLSTIDQPIMEDPDSQLDPYRQKKNNPDRGTQFNNFGGEGTQTQTVGGPNDRPPISPSSDPTGRPLPEDGGDGDHFENSSYTSQVADTSPLKQPTQQQDVNPFNYMRSLTNALQPDDPYELIRKRKFK